MNSSIKPYRIQIKHRLITKLLISHILLASIPIIVTGLLLIRTAQNSIEDIIQHRNSEFAKRAAQKIYETLDNATKIMKFNAVNILNVQQNRLAREVIINNIVNEFDIFYELYILDLSGKIENSTHYVDDSSRYVNKPFMNSIKTGKSYESDVYISREMLPFMDFAEPIKMHNEITGILYAEVNLRAMWDIMDSLVVGQRGEGLMFDSKGVYIAHSERKKVYLNEKFPDDDIIQKVSRGMFGQKKYISPEGIELIASYKNIPVKNWGVVIQQPTEEAFAQARTMRVQIFVLVMTSIIVAWLIAYYFFSERIVGPVTELISGIERFSSGELRYRIPSIGKDEISTLAIQFNNMARKLLKIQNKLKRTERIETLNKMASILSHEIKNPLNAMVINLQILKKEILKKQQDKEKINNYNNIISSEIKRLDKLVNDFLILARPPKMDEHRFVLQDVMEALLLDQKGDIELRKIQLVLNFYTSPLYIWGNKDRLKQAFLNLLLNAVQAIHENGKITITINFVNNEDQTSDSNYAKVIFVDSGEGIEDDKVKHIFDFYFTTKKSGTGLGLAVAQQIIEDHDGTIEVESKMGIGSKFTIILPVE